MKKIVVTGATSMLGAATVEECLKNDIEVVAIVRRNSKNLYRLPNSSKLKIIETNLDELSTFTPDFNDADTFYHFAWETIEYHGKTITDLKKFWVNYVDVQEKNIRYTIDAVHFAKKCGCHKFIFAGSQAEYGLSDKPLNRETPIKPFTPYGVAKFSAGSLAEILCENLDMTFVWSRILSVYGINDRPHTLISYIINCYENNIQPEITKCGQIWDYLHADDAARAFRLLGQCKTQGVYVVGSGIAHPLKYYVEIIYNLMKPNVPLVFGGKPYAENQVMFLQADISDLQRDTGFQPKISFEEGIKKILDGRKAL